MKAKFETSVHLGWISEKEQAQYYKITWHMDKAVASFEQVVADLYLSSMFLQNAIFCK